MPDFLSVGLSLARSAGSLSGGMRDNFLSVGLSLARSAGSLSGGMRDNFLFIIECVVAVLVAIPLLIIVGGSVRSFVMVVWTFYDALAEEEALYPVPATSQPARKMFALDGGWRSIVYVVQQVPWRVRASVDRWVDAGETMKYMVWSRPWLAPVGWPVVVGLQGGAYIQYVFAYPLMFFFLLIHTLLLSVCALYLLLCLVVVALLGLCWRVLYSYFVPCPYCYRPITMPVHVCSKCQARHDHLRPGVYGILSHRCRSCRTRLPTMDMLGRRRLKRLCPSCSQELADAIGRGASVHIALVGASASGKTSYLVQAIEALSRKYQMWYRLGFADQEQKKEFESSLRQVQQGKALTTSTTLAPVPYVLHAQPSRMHASKLIYLYDPTGKIFTSSEYAGRQEYYRYTDGVLLCIDASALLARTGQPGELAVMQTYERMMQLFEIFVGLSRGRGYTQPVAVVVTKSQQINELGSAARFALMQKDSSLVLEAEAMHRLVRAFLCAHGLDNMVRDLESHFEHVRYFSCPAEKAGEQEDESGQQMFVLEPLEWLLSRTRAIPRP